jgi:hypothetical protein
VARVKLWASFFHHHTKFALSVAEWIPPALLQFSGYRIAEREEKST